MVHVQKKIAVGMDVLKCFTMNNWDFRSHNYINLLKIQSKEEYDMFFVDTAKMDMIKYTQDSLKGGRIYCAKDPMTTIPKAKNLIRM